MAEFDGSFWELHNKFISQLIITGGEYLQYLSKAEYIGYSIWIKPYTFDVTKDACALLVSVCNSRSGLQLEGDVHPVYVPQIFFGAHVKHRQAGIQQQPIMETLEDLG